MSLTANPVLAVAPRAEGLLTEHLPDPLGIDVPRPLLSWRMVSERRAARQSAYQVQAASDEKLLAAGTPDLWDSGRVDTLVSQSVSTVYAGKDLSGRSVCWWRVRVWDEQGVPGEFSRPARFEMALLEPGDWQAKWISTEESDECPALRREFTVDKPVASARAYVTALGYYELRLNGKKVGDRVLDPAYTTFAKRVYYSTYDVTGLLERGSNCAAALLGKGWWREPVRFLLQIEITFADGTVSTVVSDENWRWTRSPILENSLYNGEVYDARLELQGWDRPGYDDTAWDQAALVPARQEKNAELSAQMIQPIRVVQTLKAKSISQPKPGVYVLDFGQNFSGWCRIRVSGKAGDKVSMRCSELLFPDGTINQQNLRSARATDTYILRGGGEETWEPRFTYHGFRYVQVEGWPGEMAPGSIEGRVVHTALEPRGKFECSNRLLNQVQRACEWGERTNFHAVPTDCPQRDERQGWMGDAHISAPAMLRNFDMAPAYTKYLRDIADAQREDGAVPDTVPHIWGSNPGDPVWAMAYPMILWYTYIHTGDIRLLEDHYDGVKRYLEMLRREAGDRYIIERNNYGDWVNVEGTPKDLISTGSFCEVAGVVAKIAAVLGNNEDSRAYRELQRRIEAAFNDRFRNSETGLYGNGSQFSNALPLRLSIVPREHRQFVLDAVVRDVMEKHKGHLSTGFVGTPYLMDVLTMWGREDVAYTIATKEDYPGWGYMIANGATTIWELWKLETGPGMNSHNHPMLGWVSEWYYRVLGGLAPIAESPGWEEFRVQPRPVGDLTWARAEVETPRGRAASHWRLTDDGIILKVTVPPTSRALVRVPAVGRKQFQIKEGRDIVWRGGRFVPGVSGIRRGESSPRGVVFEVESGCYVFELEETRG